MLKVGVREVIIDDQVVEQVAGAFESVIVAHWFANCLLINSSRNNTE